MRVLLTDANAKNTLALCRDINKGGHYVATLGPRGSMSHVSRHSSESIVMPQAHGIHAALSASTRASKFDVLIPVGANSVVDVHRNREKIADLTHFALPHPNSLKIALDKGLTQAHAAHQGLAVPRFYLASNYQQLRKLLEETAIPFVVKSTSHLANGRTIYVSSEVDREKVIHSDRPNPLLLFGDVQVQETIFGHGEGFFALYQNGEAKRIMMHRRLREYPSTGGSSSAAVSIDDQDLMRAGVNLLDSLDWHGPAMVEFKRSSNGELSFIELNPKLWGSLDLTIAAGVALGQDLVRVAWGDTIQPNFTFQTDKVFWWPMDSFRSLVSPPVSKASRLRTNLMLSDPFPTFYMLLSLVGTFLLNQLWGGVIGKLRHWIVLHGTSRAALRVWNEWLGLPTRRDSEVAPFLWVGAKPSSLGKLWLRRRYGMQTYSLLETGTEETEGRKSSLGLHVPEFVEISIETIETCVSQLREVIGSQGRIFLHCREGVGRAPSMAIAYLVSEGYSLEEAFELVSESRKIVNLSSQQFTSLQLFAASKQ